MVIGAICFLRLSEKAELGLLVQRSSGSPVGPSFCLWCIGVDLATLFLCFNKTFGQRNRQISSIELILNMVIADGKK